MNTKILVSGVIGGLAALALGFIFLGVGQDGKDGATGAFPGSEVYNEVAFLAGMRHTEKVVNWAPTSQWSTTTLQFKDSGTTYSISASGTTWILPAVTNTGSNFRWVVGGALDTANVVIDSAEGDNIEGTLIVAGAVVDCAAEDQINLVIDGENVGDYVEVRSNGTNWLIGDSGVLTAAKATCTDPS